MRIILTHLLYFLFCRFSSNLFRSYVLLGRPLPSSQTAFYLQIRSPENQDAVNVLADAYREGLLALGECAHLPVGAVVKVAGRAARIADSEGTERQHRRMSI